MFNPNLHKKTVASATGMMRAELARDGNNVSVNEAIEIAQRAAEQAHERTVSNLGNFATLAGADGIVLPPSLAHLGEIQLPTGPKEIQF
jgi:hypothetical protein